MEHPSRIGNLRNQVQLITYPDSLGGDLRELRCFINRYLSEIIGGVHILPFYPSSADRGFAPLTHQSVDPIFGSWDDIRQIAAQYDLVVDLTVNHLSAESEYFQDYLQQGNASLYADMFLEVEKVLDRHGVELEAFADIYRPRPTIPHTTYKLWDGTTKLLWTTFTDQQIDLDVESPMTRTLMQQFITTLVDNGADLIRLDAVGYTVKRPWTSSFLIPETVAFIRWLREITPPRVALLAEVHHQPETQLALLGSGAVDWVYDFSLPLLTLHALHTGTVDPLLRWIRMRPDHLISTLDTHDGIGVIDVVGLLTPEEIAATAAWVIENGANHSLRASGVAATDLDIYQLNSTYYSALAENDDAYITARAIQFFIPGIPQVYYVGLLAGCNDHAQLERTGHGRDINRHNYSWAEIVMAMDQAVVQRLIRLMRFRSSHPAFGGKFICRDSLSSCLQLRWEHDASYCEAMIDIKEHSVTVTYTDTVNGQEQTERF